MCTVEVYDTGQDADQDQQDMPQVRVNGQRDKRVVQTAGVREDGNSAQKRVGHEACEKNPSGDFLAQPRAKQQEIHRDTAELERKIQPVVSAASEHKRQRDLFPYFADEHDDSAQKKQPV